MAHGTRAWVLTFFCAATVSLQSQAQTPVVKESRSTREPFRVDSLHKGSELTAVEQVRRTSAILIISSLVDEADRYRDLTLRARTQARAADALWSVDQTLARGLFLRAWTTAEKVDEDGEQAVQEARNNALNSRGSGVTLIPPSANLRSEVLRLAARRDPALGEVLLAKLDAAKEREDSTSGQKNTSSEFADPTEPRLAIAKRLETALQLLLAGDVKKAKAFASPALGSATSQGIIFLCVLRQRDSTGADELYAKLLANTANDPTAEATTVSLLSSYAFSPTFLVTATRRGRVSNQFSDTTQIYELSPKLRAGFFSVAATILLRPLPPPDQDRTPAGRAGTYFTIARLLPLFERYANNYIPALNTQLALLAPDAPETFRNGEDSMLRLGLTANETGKDALPDLLDQLASAASTTERDSLYVKAIRAGATNGDARIRDFAGKIEDANLRERARSFADLAVVRSLINKKDVEGVLSIVRDGYLSPLHRVWALAGTAHILGKSDAARAMQLLNDAALEANRIGIGEPDRVYALVCVALPLVELDRSRSWEVASDVIKAANAVTNFSSEDGKLFARLRTKNIVAMINSDEPSFDIVNLFDLLSRDDLQLAISLANNLKEEAPRATATLAIAGSVLRGQKSPAVASRR